ncbi:MAG: family 16 glycosylhydrolase [Bacteroidia bacterium]|nr:family 16 glycosylhydrolase [Bacteroidia bacterium]
MKHYRFPFPYALLLAGSLTACKEETPDRLPALSIAPVVKAEGNAPNPFVFTVSLSEASDKTVEVLAATRDQTAKAGSDYTALSDVRLTFAPGTTQAEVSVMVTGDLAAEPEETFAVVLYGAVNATIATTAATGTIQNDDADTGPVIPATGYSTPEDYPGMQRVWRDEFDGTALNQADWTHEIGNGNGGWGNNELQFYRAENTSLVNGHLVIEAKQESFGGFGYTSSRLKTQLKKSFTHGRIDIRAVLPEGQGIWPALWMLGESIATDGWPACGEIDIMELVGHEPGKVHGTVHYGASFPQHQYIGQSISLEGGAKFSEEFHVFSIDWKQDTIRWYMDDKLYFTFTKAQTGAQPYPFNAPHFFIFNVAVGGNWPGSPNASTTFPQRMIVDYVRVFQKP